MKKVFLLFVALLMAAAARPAAFAEVEDHAAVDGAVPGLQQVTGLFDAEEYLSAARVISEVITDLKAVDTDDREAVLAILRQARDTLYSWLDPTENGDTWLIGKVPNVDYVRADDPGDFSDSRLKQAFNTLGWTLDLVQRNALYHYYLQMEAEGADIYALEEFPYRHSMEWGHFSMYLGIKYQADAEIPENHAGGSKLLIVGLSSNPNDMWTAYTLNCISPMDLATRGEEAGYVLELERSRTQLTKSINRKTGKEVGGTYRSHVKVLFHDLSSGETKELGTYAKDPTPGGVGWSGVGERSGQFSSGYVSKAMRNDICPVLEQYIHVFPE